MSRDSDSDRPGEQRPRDPLGLDDDPAHGSGDGVAPAAEKRSAAEKENAADELTAAGAAPMADPEPPVRPRGGRLLAGLALLLALAAAGGAGYLYYELIYLQRDAPGAPAVAADLPEPASAAALQALRAELRQALATVDERLATLSSGEVDALEAMEARQAEAREALARSLRAAIAEVAEQAPPERGEWQLAEVRYLLRIANHRLLMERDVSGALRLLEAADTVLAELDDFGLHEVRARLADEIAALEGLSSTDLQGLFLRLESAKRDLDALPLRKPEFTPAEAPGARPGDDAGAWAALQRQLANLVRIKRLDGEVKPLLAPEEAVYLELNLRLMLERAQLAALREEQLMYEESLLTALTWIERYLDTDDPAVRRLRDELDALAGVDLARPLPDVSGSLEALRQATRPAP